MYIAFVHICMYIYMYNILYIYIYMYMYSTCTCTINDSGMNIITAEYVVNVGREVLKAFIFQNETLIIVLTTVCCFSHDQLMVSYTEHFIKRIL